MKKLLMLIMLCNFLLVGCSDQNAGHTAGKDPGTKPVIQLNEDIEMETAKKVLEEYYRSFYETLDVDSNIATGINGNKSFLNYLKKGISMEDGEMLTEKAYQGRTEYLNREMTRFAEFVNAGGYIEYGVDTYLLIQDGHDYYNKCKNYFIEDEDTNFIDPNGIEAFMLGGVGIDWHVPSKMESEWGESRHDKREVMLVRYEGQWYIAPINRP